MFGKWDKLDQDATAEGGPLGYLAGDVLDRARINADDTFVDGVRVTGDEWDRIAVGSVGCVLSMRNEDVECCYSTAKADEVRSWFAARGVRW